MVTRGENCDARWPGSPPSRQEGTRSARPSDGSKAQNDSARKSGEGVRTKILDFNPESVHGKYVDIIRQRGHDVEAASSAVDAFTDIQNFTAEAQGLQLSLALFLVDE